MSAEVAPVPVAAVHPASSPLRETITVAAPPLPPTTPGAGPSSTPASPAARMFTARAVDGAEPVSPRTSARLRAKGGRSSEMSDAPPQPQPHTESIEEAGPKYLQPSEFYPLNNHSSGNRPPAPTTNETQWLSPEDDKLATRGIPIFRPSIEEFQDFEGYVTKTVPWGQYSGIVKIIPPSDWSNVLPPIPSRALSDVRIKSPIQQNMLGQAGLFRQTNVEKNKNRPLTIKQWFEKSTDKRFAAPGPKDIDMTLDRDSTAAKQARRVMEAERKKKRDELRAKRAQAAARKAERDARGQEAKENEDEQEQGEYEIILEEVNTSVNGETSISIDKAEPEPHVEPVPPLDPSNHHSPQSSPDPLAKTPESNPDPIDKWYEHFDPSKAWLPKDTNQEDYTPEACVQMERKFWKNMGLGEPSWYGADLQGTLFPDPETPWNVAHLPNLLNRLGRELPGVNRPYLYFGMWRAAFAWHVEDMDLFSINYIHFGAPKFWYAIPQGQAEQFERTITGYFPREAAECDQFLRHKSYVMSPTRLAKDGIHVNMLVHNQGEFVITYPRGYHAGFNLGFNCAESVNFALDSWVELGRRAKVCQCVSHSVRIDVDELLGQKEAKEALAAQREKLKTEQEIMDAIEAERMRKPRKRMFTSADGERPRKRAKPEPSIAGGDDEDGIQTSMPVNGMEKKKKTVLLEHKVRPVPAIVRPPTTYPCVLCPHQSEEGLLPVYEPAEYVKNMCKAKDGIPKVHDICVNSIPEVWVSEEVVDGLMQSVVRGVNEIEKGRWGLKCQSCKDKKIAATGAKVQCVNGKCPRAFHVTCARDDEQVVYRVWEVDEWKPLPIAPDAPADAQHEFEKVKTLKTEVLCPNHNPDVKEAKRAQQLRELKDRVMAILPGQTVKIKTTRGSYEVKLVRAIEESQTAEVQHENGSSSFVKWTEFDFRPGPAQLLENEYARVHTHTRRTESGSSVPVQPPASATQPTVHPPSNGGFSRPAPRQQQPTSKLNRQMHPTPIIPSQGDVRERPLHTSHPPQQNEPRTSATSTQPLRHPHHPQAVHAYPPPVNHGDPRVIPSRVVLCDSQYGNPPHHPYPQQHPRQHISYHPPPYQVPHNYQHPPAPIHNYSQHPPPPGYHSLYLPLPPHHATYPPDPAWTYAPPYQTPSGSHVQSRQYSTHGSPPHHHLPVHGHPQPHVQARPASSVQSTSTNVHGPRQIAQPAANGHRVRLTSTTKPSTGTGMGGVGQIDLGIQRMTDLMRHLAPVRTPAIHLAGTNGKGSVSAILESCLQQAGLKVARYNSPHLIEPRDAIALDGAPPSPEIYAAAMKRVHDISSEHKLGATTFEIATAAAYDLITTFNPDIMLIECGMGGEGDATNVIPPQLVLATGLTAVGLDHTAFLGDTIEQITKVKAGIAVKGGITCIAPQQYPEVIPFAQKVVQKKGSRMIVSSPAQDLSKGAKQKLHLERFDAPPSTSIWVQYNGGAGGSIEAQLGLPGKHQLDNVSLAVNLLTAIRSDSRALGIQPKLKAVLDTVIRKGIAGAKWPGRCSWLKYPLPTGSIRSVPVLVDGAHNSDSATTLRTYIDSLDITPPNRPITWVLALSDSKGKTPESVLEPLLRKGDSVYATQFGDVEGMPWVKPVAQNVVRDIASGITGNEVVIKADVGEVMRDIADEKDRGLVVVAGSLYLVAEFYKLLGEVGV